MGHSIKRKEDPRFVRGQGTYVDDIRLPGMIYLDIVRSPFAHATIKKINPSKALSIPGVLAVITGQDLAKYNLHWMPTLMSDTQMVLPVDKVTGKLTVWLTTQAPHAIRTVVALVAGHVGLSEERIRIIAPDIGGGFGGKVPVYPGYVIAIAATVLTGKPVKWVEDRMENLQADSFARDYHITAELAAEKDGTLTALRIKTIADHGYTDAAANPSKFPAGLFGICTGSYNLKAAHVQVDGAYTNKPPGGIAYRCSFRVTEAAYAIERMVDIMAHELNMDPADFRRQNFIPPDKFPYKSALGWEYASGNYDGALTKPIA